MTVEEWRPAPGYEGIYEVSDHGRVRRSAPGKGTWPGRILSQAAHNGYFAVTLTKDRRQRRLEVHPLICEAWHGPRPSPEHVAAHWDDRPGNNVPPNLRWATRSQNALDSRRNGSMPLGEERSNAILTAAAVRHIRALPARRGANLAGVAARYGTSKRNVQKVRAGRTWKHLAGSEG